MLFVLYFQWLVPEVSAPITHAPVGLLYLFLDGTICIFRGSDLRPQYRINSVAYLPSGTAPGLTDDTVLVCEPLESDGKWDVPPPVERIGNRVKTPMPDEICSSSDQTQGTIEQSNMLS
ncbi:hypothetical protein U1Q18_018614 [Sarracenia purpurea var. burkii]